MNEKDEAAATSHLAAQVRKAIALPRQTRPPSPGAPKWMVNSQQEFNAAHDALDELERRVERLRAALEEIRDTPLVNFHACPEIARQALADNTRETP